MWEDGQATYTSQAAALPLGVSERDGLFYPQLYAQQQAMAASGQGFPRDQPGRPFQQGSAWTPQMHQRPAAHSPGVRGPPWQQRINQHQQQGWRPPPPPSNGAATTAPHPGQRSAPTPAPTPTPAPAVPPTMKRIVKHQPTSGADLALSSQGGSQRLEIIDPNTMAEILITPPEGVPLAPIGSYQGPKQPVIPEGAETIEVCDDEGGPPPEPTQQMDAAFLQSIVEHIISGGDDTSPFHERDHQCYLFSVTSLNDGEMRQYDGTLNEIWKVMLSDVRHVLKETNLSDECEAVVMGDDPSFELLLTE
eukprot:GGOE01005284.1.p2 GENE.GGOE01005284.1~~GGOE01005284.1.p2  ORF type:complete len:329 (-),score=94.08 GGOE01005284.1:290-1207(-)